jgi:hypothetical protein
MENDKIKKIKVINEKDQSGSQKELEIQDSSLNTENEEDRPGIGIEIFGIPNK